MAGLKTASGETIDGSFELQVEVEEGDAGGQAPPPAGPPCPPAAPRTLALRVTGDLHVGGLMLLIVETVGVQRDWSDHALWWVQRRQWLLRPARTLDALGVGGDARLRFAPQHRPLRLRLPNRRCLRLRLSFAEPLAQGVSQACRLLGIRYPEELSLLWPLEEEEAGGEGRKGSSPPPPPDFDLSHLALPPGEGGSVSSEPLPHLPPDCYRMLVAPRGGLGPIAPPRTPRGNPLLRRTRLHAGWLDSSRSLMEQDVADDEELLLRFKYHCFLDLGPQQDSPRLALLYEQARWALLTEEIDCTEEEMMLFAALQYHIDEVVGSGEPGGAGGGSDLDDLDVALSNLEVKLGGGTEPLSPLEELAPVPELAEELEIYRPRKLALRGFRPTWAVLKETSLSYGRSPPTRGEPLQQLNLRGCEVTPDVDVGAQKFCIKLLVAAPEGMSEIQLRCRDLVPRILEVLHRLGALPLPQARLRFLEAWRALPGFGLAHFLVRFKGSRRDEVLAIGPSRLLRLEPGSGTVTRAWRHSALRQWNVNWDTQQVTLELEGQVTLALAPRSAPCRVLHEFLGGYLCLAGRQPGQPLDLRLFQQLTGGQEPL
ncbi:fermitin family homolog 3-like isoform X2 [Falco naumanni]|uniref:fermitin family homolog 3-like isoform X2 n=1 Tax=Falco naumanni TaxID=148594 RepID=UPI001ADE11CC|nr:fermitin family homolog 3-like isoform X2 [Falco naumanni]